MNIFPVKAFQDNYIWVLINQEQQCVCVDPGDADPVIEYVNDNQLQLTGILITHHHFDHIGGVDKLLATYPNLPVFGPHDNRIPQITRPLKEQDRINIFHAAFEIIAIPGHTSTHIAYYDPDLSILFCGDTLFSAGCGRVFDGTIKQLFESLCTLNELPPTTNIYCAHEYTLNNCRFASSIEPNNRSLQDKIDHLIANPAQCSLPSRLSEEKTFNPFLRVINRQLSNTFYPNLSPLKRFEKLRQLKDTF